MHQQTSYDATGHGRGFSSLLDGDDGGIHMKSLIGENTDVGAALSCVKISEEKVRVSPEPASLQHGRDHGAWGPECQWGS